jgi:hypothetical protein
MQRTPPAQNLDQIPYLQPAKNVTVSYLDHK